MLDAALIVDGEMFEEIPPLGIEESIRQNPDGLAKRRALLDWIDSRLRSGSLSATSVAVESIDIKTMCLEAVRGVEIVEGAVRTAERRLESEWRVRLATVDGKPLADRRLHARGEAHLRGVKYAQRAMGGAEGRDYEARGGTLNMYREYGPVFEVDLVEAHRVLAKYGWRLAPERSHWLVYEVGGPLERELALWMDKRAFDADNAALKARARAICPAAFDDAAPDDQTNRRRAK